MSGNWLAHQLCSPIDNVEGDIHCPPLTTTSQCILLHSSLSMPTGVLGAAKCQVLVK